METAAATGAGGAWAAESVGGGGDLRSEISDFRSGAGAKATATGAGVGAAGVAGFAVSDCTNDTASAAAAGVAGAVARAGAGEDWRFEISNFRSAGEATGGARGAGAARAGADAGFEI